MVSVLLNGHKALCNTCTHIPYLQTHTLILKDFGVKLENISWVFSLGVIRIHNLSHQTVDIWDAA